MINEQYRNMGIGSNLLALIELSALQKGIENISLSVAVNNPAINLYLRSSFTEINNIETYIAMNKQL